MMVLIFSSSQFVAADDTNSGVLSLQPQTCLGWEHPDLARGMDVPDGGTAAAFTSDNSATYHSSLDRLSTTPGDSLVVGSLDAPSSTITCGTFSLDAVAPTATITAARLLLSFTSQSRGNTTSGFFVQITTNGTAWKTLSEIPVQTDTTQRLSFPLDAALTREAWSHLQVRLAPDIGIGAPPVTAWLDGLAVQVTAITPRPVNQQKNTQAIHDLDKLVAFSKQAYKSAETPIMTVPKRQTTSWLFFGSKKMDWSLTQVMVMDSKGKRSIPAYTTTDRTSGSDTETLVSLQTANLHPGKYTMTVSMRNSDNGQATVEKEFLWGVVALNVSEAVAKPGDQEQIGIGILDDAGKTICDATITVKVTDPQGKTGSYTTDNTTMTRNPGCVDKGVTNEPDYFFSLTPDQTGLYRIALQATTTAGERTTADTFQVDPGVPFVINRTDVPTRIYPPADYPIRVAVTPGQPYRGQVTETVPASFAISHISDQGSAAPSVDRPDSQRITWDVDWQVGTTYYLGYTFNAPDISPALFTLGPMAIGGSFTDAPLFREPRQWQIASDAVNIRVQGTLYSDEGTTALNCASVNRTVKLEVNGATAYSTTCTLAAGTYDFGTTISVVASDVLTIYISAATEKAVRTTRVAATPADIASADLYQNRTIVTHEDAGPTTNTNLSNWTSTNDTDVKYSVTAGALTVSSGTKLIVWTGKTFTPGGSVTTTAASTAGNPDGDILIQSTATLSMGTNALSIGGDFVNSGTLSKSTGQTTTFTATGAGFGITMGTGNFDSLTFNGSGGDWTPTNAVSVDVDLTMTAGTLKGTQNVTVTGAAAGTAGIITLTGGTFEQRVTAGKNFGPTTASTSWSFSTLTLSNGNSTATAITITAQSCSTCGVTVTSILNIGKTLDATGATTTLNAGNKTWTLSGTSTPLVLLASPAAVFTASTSTVNFTGNAATTIPNLTWNNLGAGVNDGSSVTYSTTGGTVNAALTIATGDTLSTSGTLNVWNTGSLTLNGTLAGAGNLTYYPSATFPTTGSVTVASVNFNCYFNDQTIGGRSDYVAIQASCTVGVLRTISVAGNITTSGAFSMSPNASTTVVLDATSANPTVSIGGSFSTSNTTQIKTGTGSWTVGGHLDLTGDTLTAATGNTITMTGQSRTFVTNNNTLYNFTVSVGNSGNNSISGNLTVTNNFTATSTGRITGPSSGTITVGGTFSNSGTFTHNNSTVILNGASGGIAGSTNTPFYNLTISGAVTQTASNPTVANTLVVNNGNTLTINSGLTLTLTANTGTSLTLNGTINGPGTLTYQNSATTFPTTGTLAASLITRFDTVNGNMSIPARTDYGAIEAFGASANARTVTVGTAGSQTITTSSYFYIIANAASPNNVTVSATTNNPTVNVGGDLDFTGTGSSSEVLQSGTGPWTASGSVDFTAGTYTATSGTTLVMNGTSKTLTSASQNLYNFTVSGGTVTVGDATTITNDLSVTGGTMSGTNNITVNGNATGTAGIVNLTGGTFEQRVAASKNFGPTTASTAWTFSTLTFSNSNGGATPITITAQACSTCGVTVSSVLNIGKNTDTAGATTTLSAGDKTWTLSGSGTPLVLATGPAAVLTASTSTVSYTSTSAVTATNVTYYNLTMAPSGAGGPTYTLPSGTLTVNNNLTVGDGTNAVTVSNTTNNTVVNVTSDLTANAAGTLSGSGTGTMTVNGNVTGAGTINLTGNTFEQRVAAAKNFGSSSGSNVWTFNHLTFSNSHASTGFTITYQTGGTGDTSVTGTLTVSKVGDAAATTLSLASGRTITSGTGGTVTINTSGTISGSGTLIVQNSNLGTGGTLSSAVRLDATNGDITMPNRTYGGAVEIYNNHATLARVITMAAGTHTLSSTLTVTSNSGGNVTLAGATNNPTVNLTGDLAFTKNSTGTVTLTSGTGTWTCTGNVNFSNGTYTATSGNTLVMNGASKTLTTNANALQNLTFSGSTLTTLADNISAAGNVILNSTISAGSTTLTMTGTSKNLTGGTATLSSLTVNGNTTLLTSNLTVSGTLTMGASTTLTITTVTLTDSGTTDVSWGASSVIGGTGNLTFTSSTTGGPGTAGTLSVPVTFDASTASIPSAVFDARTYGGAVTLTATNAAARSITAIAGGYAFSSTLTTTAGGAGTVTGDLGAATGTVTVTGTVSIGATTALTAPSALTVSASFTNSGTFTHNSGTLTMNGTGTLTSNGNTLNNFTTSGGGTITLANATHTLAGNLNIGSTGLTAGTSTVAMTGTTKTIDGGGKTLSGLTISGDTTLQNTDLTVSGTLQVDNTKTLTINVSRLLTHSGATLTLNGTIAGAGTYVYQSATAFPTTGTINSILRMDATSNNQTLSARTYGGEVDGYSNSSSAARTITLASGTLTFSSNFYLVAANSQDMIVAGDTNNPTITITGNLDFTGTGNGTEVVSAGTGTWTVSGNVDLTSGIYGPKVAVLAATFSQTANQDRAVGSDCTATTSYICASGTYEWTDTSNCVSSIAGDLIIGRAASMFNPTGISDTATILSAQLGAVIGTATGTEATIGRGTTDDVSVLSCTTSAMWNSLAGSNYGSTSGWTSSGGKLHNLGSTGVSDIQSRITGTTARLTISIRLSTLDATQATFTTPTNLYVGYIDGGTPTLTMNGSGKTLTTAGNSLYNLNLASAITLANETDNIYGNLDLTSGTITAGTSTVIMNGATKTVTGGGATLANLTIAGSTTLQTTDLTVSSLLTINASTTLTINASRTLTLSANSGTSLTLNGTISGAGTLTYQNTGTTLTTAGTLSSIVRLDTVNGNLTMPNRTYGGDVEIFGNTANVRSVTMSASTHTISGNLKVITGASQSQVLTLAGATNNPTVNLTGSISFTQAGSATPVITSGTGIWTVTGSVTFTNGTYTATSGNTLAMNGNGTTLTFAGSALNHLTISGSSVTVTAADAGTVSSTITASSTDTLTLSGNLTSSTTGTVTISGTVNGTSTLIMQNSNLGTGGTLSSPVRFDATNGDITQPTRTYGGAVEIYNNHATLARAVTMAAGTHALSSTLTVTSNSGGNVTLAGATNNPTVNMTGDLAFTKNSTGTVTLTSGTGIWTASGNVNFTNGTYTAASGNTLTMNGASKTLTTNANSLQNLTFSGSGTTTLADSVTATGNVTLNSTISAGTTTFTMSGTAVTLTGGTGILYNLTVSGTVTLQTSAVTAANTLSVTGTLSGGQNVTVNGTTSGSGTITMSGGTFEQRVAAAQNFGSTSNANNWTFSNLTFSNSSGINRTVTFATGGTGQIIVSGTLTVGNGSDTNTTVIDNETNDRIIAANGAVAMTTKGSLTASSTASFTVGGAWTLTSGGVFTAGSGTVTLNGSSQQTVTGTMTGANQFNNLTITNASGSDPDTSPSVIFASDLTTAGTFQAATNDVKLRFAASGTYTLTAINFTGTSGHRVFLHSSTGGTQWHIVAGAGARTVTYTSVKDSEACSSTGGSIDGSDGTNISEINNSCWSIATLTVALSGTSASLGALDATHVNQAGITSTVSTSGPNGYASLVKYNNTLTDATNDTIADTSGPTIAIGQEKFGVSTSETSPVQTITGWSPASCATTTTPSNATALTTSFQGFASSNVNVSSQATTLCFLAGSTATTKPGSYTSTATIVTTSRF